MSALMIPDPHFESVAAFVRESCRAIESWKPDVVITFAYPFSMQVVGAWIKKRHPGILWVADYGDPWSGGGVEELNRPAWRRRLDAGFEKRLLKEADLVSLTTRATRILYEHQFPGLVGRTAVVTMGFDPDDYDNLPSVTDDSFKRIVHAGRLYSDARDFMPFHMAVVDVHARVPHLLEGWRVTLVGEVEPRIREAVDREPCGGVFEFVSWVTYHESLAWMAEADWLLLVGNKGMIQVPGKVYNYLGAGTPIFMTSEHDNDPTAQLLNGDGNAVVARNDTVEIARTLEGVLTGAINPPRTGGRTRHSLTWNAIARGLASEIASRAERAES